MKKQIIPILLALAVSNIYAEQIVKYTYNSAGQISSIDGPRSDLEDTTTYTYNTNGQLKTIINPLGHKITYSQFDNRGNPKNITDENGIVSILTYTKEGWLASITTAEVTTRFTYDAIGQITKVTFPDNSTLTYIWDDAKRLTSITNSLNDSINYSYDAMGNRVEETVKKGSTITKQLKRQYDELGRVMALVGANGQTYKYTYTAFTNPKKEIDPKGTEISHYYNEEDYLTEDGYSGKYAKYGRNAHGDITNASDFGGSNTQYTFSDVGEVIEEQSKAIGLTAYKYDKAGNLIKEINARGDITHYSYDALNRLINQAYPNKSELNIEYIYDQPVAGFSNIGYLTTINDASGTTHYNYDNTGEVVQQKNQLKLDGELLGTEQVINYSYDKMGRMLSANYGTVILKYIRNAGGEPRAVTLTNKNGVETTLADNIVHQPFQAGITSLTWGNQLALMRSYDLDGQLSQQKIGNVTTDYQYDVNGNITQIADSQFGTTNYEYNELNRLTKEQGQSTITYSYDFVGNRLTRVDENLQQKLTYITGNVLNTISSTYYQKDTLKNIISYKDSTKTYEYDESNRFAKVVKTENKVQTTLARYIHNAYGERTIKVKEDGNISTFIYNDIGQLIGETQYNAVKEKVKEIYWVWLDTLPIAQIEVPFANGMAGAQVVYYIHSDHLDTPRWATNQNGQKVWSWQSDAYGNTLANQDPLITGVNTTIPLRFAGQYFDFETGFHYNYFRTYIPDLGRYSQSDPIGLNGGWNTFVYVGGNPISWVDMFGLRFPSQEKAAEVALSNANPQSIQNNIEYCGYITYNECDNTYDYTTPKSGDEASCHAGVPPRNTSAHYHTHGYAPPGSSRYERFSKSDWGLQGQLSTFMGRDMSLYLATPQGRMGYMDGKGNETYTKPGKIPNK